MGGIFKKVNTDFNEKSLVKRLVGRTIGTPLYFFDAVDSTNNVAFKLASNGACEGTAIIADHQWEGKGRLSRRWQSPPQCNIYTSVIFKPKWNPVHAPRITLMAGVGVARLLSEYCPGHITLKWPNDVLIRGKKVCGILIEMKTTGDQCIDFVIVGIGINVNMRREDFHESIRDVSTSLREEVGYEVSRAEVLVRLFEELERVYSLLVREGFGPIRETWLAYSDMVGKTIQVRCHDFVISGTMTGVDEDGALLLRDGDGTIRRVLAGDASIVRG